MDKDYAIYNFKIGILDEDCGVQRWSETPGADMSAAIRNYIELRYSVLPDTYLSLLILSPGNYPGPKGFLIRKVRYAVRTTVTLDDWVE